ncbi:MAG: helix-turn-helix domain-containing protein [Candidatus Scalindua sp.]|jgi:predicted DNA-binding transcriptional regulator AlpA|nr:helix-turn-helix domain-containing protein [Candidatus Scalindua sp.]MBT7590546.1 helix-turn-helix domain-containing protein [Candidatus Scalindua sp.]
MDGRLLKPKDVEALLGIARTTLYAWSHQKINLQPRRIGRLLRYTEKDVKDFIEKKRK